MPRQNKINTLYFFVVEGTFEFPFDMLRYDRCWPQFENETPLFAPHRLGKKVQGERKLHLVGLREPTVGRWASFGWKVVESSAHAMS